MSNLERLIRALMANDGSAFLEGRLIGLEKESLRVAVDGTLSQKPHPRALGSALMHPAITTDYSEAMLELITPPMSEAGKALSLLCDIHKFVYDNIGDEILWSTSMPCVLAGETHIPIAEYGTSHAGRMKHLYRVGLGHRYGKVMQVISGVHFNYSVDENFWSFHAELQGRESKGDLQPFINDAYMGMVRNLQRHGWIIPYLFGASPAVCKSFFGHKTVTMMEFDKGTWYEPFATSLRMSDIGYQNQKEESVGIKANYDSLQTYIDSLRCAIETPAPLWEMVGLKNEDGSYRQLNTNILQIENEYYSTVRPKQVLQGMEKPVNALQRRGIRYIELRSLDINAFEPLGINETQLNFLEVFLLACLLRESPPVSVDERAEIDSNLQLTALHGRDEKLRLRRNGTLVRLRDWLGEILSEMVPLAELLDSRQAGQPYLAALHWQQQKVGDTGMTPSARMLEEMRENGESFYEFARRKSAEHRRYFDNREIDSQRLLEFRALAAESIEQQHQREAADRGSFDEFLSNYFKDKL
jgi:glutamate--cysteine ligase